MLNVFGEVAGQIWNHLSENGKDPVTVASLAKKLGLKKEEVTYSIGWLAREGKINCQKSGASIKVSLAE